MREITDFEKVLHEKFKDLYWWLIPDKFVIFDLETTGLLPRRDRILEIGAISIDKEKFLENGFVEVFECFVRQEKSIPSGSQRINHITDMMVKDGYSEYEALKNFFDFCQGNVMFAYNSKFDVKFIEWTARRCNYPIEDEDLESVQDIYKLAKKYISQDFLPNRKLITIAEKIGVKVELGKQHRAGIDSATALYVYIFLKQLEFNEKHFSEIQSAKLLATVSDKNERFWLNDTMTAIYK